MYNQLIFLNPVGVRRFSISQLKQVFPFWKEKKIRKIANSLLSQGVLRKERGEDFPHIRTECFILKENTLCPIGDISPERITR